MKLLEQNNKSNLLYKFALALCQTNPITGEPVFPNNRMPFGLAEYQILCLTFSLYGDLKMKNVAWNVATFLKYLLSILQYCTF